MLTNTLAIALAIVSSGMLYICIRLASERKETKRLRAACNGLTDESSRYREEALMLKIKYEYGLNIDSENRTITVLAEDDELTMNDVYMRIMKIWDEPCMMDGDVPIKALTPSLFCMQDGWTLVLKNGKIFVSGPEFSLLKLCEATKEAIPC